MGEVFQELCPTYLSYGMTYDQYWHGNPWMVVHFARAHKLRMERRNWEMWMQGLYNYAAFSTTLTNAFSKPGSTPKTYLEAPEPIFPKTEEEIEAEEERELRKMVYDLNKWEKAFNAQHGTPNPEQN